MSGFKVSKSTARRQSLVASDRMSKLIQATADLTDRDAFVREITSLWQDAQQRFLTIGRYLNQAKERLPHGEFTAMIERDLPFDRNIAFQMRSVAEAVDRGRFIETELPPTYSVAYQIVSLKDDEVEKARAAQLVRPDVKRTELVQFKKTLRAPKPGPKAGELDEAALTAEKERLLARVAEIDRLLAGISTKG